MSETLMLILKMLVMTVVPVILSALTTIAKQYVDAWIDKNAKEHNKEQLKKITDIAANAVLYTQQTFVDELKNANAFTEEAKEEAFKIAYDNTIALLNEDLTKVIENNYGDMEKYITLLIEGLVNQNKGYFIK